MSTTNGAMDQTEKLQKASRQIRYLAQYAIVEETGISQAAKYTVMTVAGLVVAFIAWAGLMEVDEVATSFGTVVPAKSVQVVQHLEGGIVGEILVEDRAMVDKGQVLVRLNPVQAKAEFDQMQSRRVGLLVRSERLQAFVEGRDPKFDDVDPRFADLIEDQKDILVANTERWISQSRVLEEQIQQKRAEIFAAQQQQRAVKEQLNLVSQEVEMREKLFEKGYTSKVDVFAAKRQRAAAQSELSRLRGQEATATKALEELNRRIIDLDNNQRQDALGELGTVSVELKQIDDAMARLQDRVTRLDVVSPVRGFVQNLKAKTIGAVIPAGGVLMEIVPMDDELQVEAKISTQDVGHVKPGQSVNVKVASYDFVRYGSVEGVLKDVSATTYVDEKDGTPYYRGRVTLTQGWIGDKGSNNLLIPGMTVQADIITGNKTLLQYLLKPLQRSYSQAFHER